MMRQIFDGVFQLDLPWVNAWLLIKNNEATIIDTGTARDRQRLLKILKATPALRLHSILLTHGHCDHAGNMAFLAEKFDAKIYAHSHEVPYIATPQTYVPRGIRAISPGGVLFALGEWYWPVQRRDVDVKLADGDSIETPIGTLTVVSTPGHTPGHVSYFHEREGWLFSGDALLNVVPWVRRTGLSLPMPIFTDDMNIARISAKRLAELEPRALLAGHGHPLLQDTAAAMHRFIDRLPK